MKNIKIIYFSILVTMIIILGGCSENKETETTDKQIQEINANSEPTKIEEITCGQCQPLNIDPSYCQDGKIFAGRNDSCGCPTAPICVKRSDMYYCSPTSKTVNTCTTKYEPVCGWYNEKTVCNKYPCAETYQNSCNACKDERIDYYTKGGCPTSP